MTMEELHARNRLVEDAAFSAIQSVEKANFRLLLAFKHGDMNHARQAHEELAKAAALMAPFAAPAAEARPAAEAQAA